MHSVTASIFFNEEGGGSIDLEYANKCKALSNT